MTIKESIVQVCSTCEYHLVLAHQRCPFKSISNEHCDEYNGLLKIAKFMEIIKEHKLLNYVLKNKKCANMYNLTNEELKLLQEVLDHEI